MTAVGGWDFLRATDRQRHRHVGYELWTAQSGSVSRETRQTVNTAGTVEGRQRQPVRRQRQVRNHDPRVALMPRGQSYTGRHGGFSNNVIDSAVVFPALLTFTNARATVFPCELNPTITVGCQQPGSGKWNT